MSAMTASFTVAPAHARATASIRRASAKRSGARVVRKSIRAEAVKEKTSTLNTTKSDAVRDDAPSSRSRGRRRALAIARRRATSRRPRRAGYDARRGRRDCFSRDTHTTSVYPWAPVARRVQRARLAPSPRGLRSASTRARRPRARPRVDPAPRARFARRARGRRGRSAGPPPRRSAAPPRQPTNPDQQNPEKISSRSSTHALPPPPSSSSSSSSLSQIFKAAQDILPGGVNSPVRAFKSVGGGPIVFESVKDAYAFDVDGNKYVDYVGSWGPAICGHANERVNAKLKAQIDKGTSFGAPCELENVLGQMVIDRVPSVEMVRFCNSGTEARSIHWSPYDPVRVVNADP
jgi:hypothetical protein